MARILHVIEPTTAGVPALVRAFSAEQARKGHDVHVLAPSGMPPVPGATLHPWSLTRRRPTSVWAARRELRGLAEQLQPDIVHIRSFVAGVVARLRPLRSHKGRPGVVYQPRAWAYEVSDLPGVARALAAWERYAARLTDLLVTKCADELQEGRRHGVATPADVLGVCVDLERFRPVPDERRQALRDELGLESRHVVTCVGRLTRQKNQAALVAEWERAPVAGAALVLVGPGDEATIAAQAPTSWGRSVIAVGGQEDVLPSIWASDLLVFPSRYEGLSLVPGEAMACGRPLFRTEVNGLAEILCEPPLAPAGIVVPRDRPAVLLDEVRRRLLDSQLLTRETRAARERAEALFPVERIGDRLEAAYGRAAARRGTPAA